jgi:hypothetical protein
LNSLLAETRRRNAAFLDYLYLILSFRVINFLFAFPKHTAALHYRYDIQMYCTFVLFVNQHFSGLPASGTHCIMLIPSNCLARLRKAMKSSVTIVSAPSAIRIDPHPNASLNCYHLGQSASYLRNT